MEKELKYYGHMDTVEEDLRRCLQAAIDATDLSYSPYSKFSVGAAVLCGNEVYKGANQENASFPLCVCAERVALYAAAMAVNPLTISCMAITAKSPLQKLDKPVMPCGACRQVILEYEQRVKSDIKILFVTNDLEVYGVSSVKVLLPYHFEASNFIEL